MKVSYREAYSNRQDWLTELRSGQFEQTRGELANLTYTSFCCLGVAEETVGKKFDIRRALEGGYIRDSGRVTTVLHPVLREAMGFSEEQQAILINLNDSLKASFSNIAEIVRLMDYHCADGIYTHMGVKLANIY